MTSLPEKATSKKRRVGYWLGLGLAPHAIAAKTGLGLTTVTQYIKLPEVQQVAEMVRTGELKDLVEVAHTREILENAAPRAAERLVEIMDLAAKDSDALKAAEAVLDRTGFAKQTEIKKTVIYLDAEAVKLIEDTKKLIPEADWDLITDGEENNE